jgi:hypothetical protein
MQDRNDTEALTFTDRALLASTMLVEIRKYYAARGARVSFSRIVRPMILSLSLGRCAEGCGGRGDASRWECCDYRRLSYAAQDMARQVRS